MRVLYLDLKFILLVGVLKQCFFACDVFSGKSLAREALLVRSDKKLERVGRRRELLTAEVGVVFENLFSRIDKREGFAQACAELSQREWRDRSFEFYVACAKVRGLSLEFSKWDQAVHAFGMMDSWYGKGGIPKSDSAVVSNLCAKAFGSCPAVRVGMQELSDQFVQFFDDVMEQRAGAFLLACVIPVDSSREALVRLAGFWKSLLLAAADDAGRAMQALESGLGNSSESRGGGRVASLALAKGILRVVRGTLEMRAEFLKCRINWIAAALPIIFRKEDSVLLASDKSLFNQSGEKFLVAKKQVNLWGSELTSRLVLFQNSLGFCRTTLQKEVVDSSDSESDDSPESDDSVGCSEGSVLHKASKVDSSAVSSEVSGIGKLGSAISKDCCTEENSWVQKACSVM